MDFGGWVGLGKLGVWILVREIIRTPRNPIIIVIFLVVGYPKSEHCSGFVNPYGLLDDP